MQSDKKEQIDAKQNYYLDKIDSPLREQIRAIGVDIHINKQIDPTITAQARLHVFGSTTEYVISKVNEALANKDFVAMKKYLPMLGFSPLETMELVDLQNVELQKAYLAINTSIEQGVFGIGSDGNVGEAKKALAEALLNKDQDGVIKALQTNFVLLPPDLSSDKSENRLLALKVFDEVIPRRFREKLVKEPDRRAAEIPLMKALLSGDKTEIAAVLTSKFGMEKALAEEMVPKLQSSLTARVLQERFSSTVPLKVPMPVSQRKKQAVAEVSPPPLPRVEVAAKLSLEPQAKSVVITPSPVVKYPSLTEQARNPPLLGGIRRKLEVACGGDTKLVDEVDHIVGQNVGEKRANGKPVTARDITTMIEETSKALKLSKAKQVAPEPVEEHRKTL